MATPITTSEDEDTYKYKYSAGNVSSLPIIQDQQQQQLEDQQQPAEKECNHEHANQRANNIGLFSFAFLAISVASGTVYGWPSLRRQLVHNEGSTLDEASLGMIYTCGSWATQACRFFFGVARDCDRGGTNRTTCASLVCVAAGSFGIAMAGPNDTVALSVSMFFMGMGSGTQLCLQPVAGLFPHSVQGLLISTLSGAFQLAGLVFVVLTAATTDRRAAFGTFAALLLGLTVMAAAILPYGNFTSSSTPPMAEAEMLVTEAETGQIIVDDDSSLSSEKQLSNNNTDGAVCFGSTNPVLPDCRDNELTDKSIATTDVVAESLRDGGDLQHHQDKPVATILRTPE